MDDVDYLGAYENQASTSQSPPESLSNGYAPSGITLVLPSLKAIKAAKAGKKSKLKNAAVSQEVKKILRPVKLKPLKEVLTKVIAQIKKKDDYAFFIHPVDPGKVPGYAEVIRNPMDFGTMTAKVHKGKYRSLEEFSSDFRLVINNAKIFNAPGSIYHAEAERIESWGLEHISKASAHVIEYETNWSVEIENEDEGTPVNVDEEEILTQRDADGNLVAASPAPSATPAPGRRAVRGPKKNPHLTLSEALDAEGRLPGSRDGVGAFPPGSDWAELMIALKIKGKRYKTKKERLRFEKEGPPCCVDGSLDFAEMEDPFSVLNAFVPDPPSRPHVTPLYPTPLGDGKSHPPEAIMVSSDRAFPSLSTVQPVNTHTTTSKPTGSAVVHPTKKRRHWTIVRNSGGRSRFKENEPEEASAPARGTSRVALPADWGTFAELVGTLATDPDSSRRTNVCGSEQQLHAALRSSVTSRPVTCTDQPTTSSAPQSATAVNKLWTDEAAVDGWNYLLDVVYGGVDGFAYVRSLAEFLRRPPEFEAPVEPAMPLGLPVAHYVENNLVYTITQGRHSLLRDIFHATHDISSGFSHLPTFGLGARQQARQSPSQSIDLMLRSLSKSPSPLPEAPSFPIQPSLVPDPDPNSHSFTPSEPLQPISAHLHPHIPNSLQSFSPCYSFIGAVSPGHERILSLPRVASALEALCAPLDMAALLRSPDELMLASALESTRGYGEDEPPKAQIRHEDNASGEGGGESLEGRGKGEGSGLAAQLGADVAIGAGDKPRQNQGQEHTVSEHESIEQALWWSAFALEKLRTRMRVGQDSKTSQPERRGGSGSGRVSPEGGGGGRTTGVIVKMEDNEVAVHDAAFSGLDTSAIPDCEVGAPMMDVDMDASAFTDTRNHTFSPIDNAPHDNTDEDPLLRRIRLNLIALAKLAPLDKIARLPTDLVPESIRGIVPTV